MPVEPTGSTIASREQSLDDVLEAVALCDPRRDPDVFAVRISAGDVSASDNFSAIRRAADQAASVAPCRSSAARQATAAAAGVTNDPAQGPRQRLGHPDGCSPRATTEPAPRVSKYRLLGQADPRRRRMLQTSPPGMTRMFAVSVRSAHRPAGDGGRS